MKLLALSVLVLAGCPDRTVVPVPPVQNKVEVKDIAAVPNRDLDLLFVIDNSSSMQDEQESLTHNFKKMIEVVETIDGGPPDLHIGVVTTDLGTSAIDGSVRAGKFDTCDGRGENGAMRALPNGDRFIRDGAGGANYTGMLPDAFAAIANVDTKGCGIEQPLEAMKRALDGNATNAGFVRDGAYLAVVFIGDEDDCSLATGGLFDGTSNGEAINFRCTSEGVACDSPATPFESAPGQRRQCHPRTDATKVATVDRYVEFLKGVKPDPLDIVVAGIVGDPDKFEIVKPDGTTKLKESCSYVGQGGTTQVAYPAVRTAAFLSAFQLSTRTTICDGDLSDGLEQIGALLKKVIADPCFDNQLADVDPETPGDQFDCTVVDVRRRPNLPDEELAVIPSCTFSGGAAPCWHVEVDNEHCGYTHANPHRKLVVDRTATPAPDVHVKASCVTAEPPPGQFE